MFAITNQLTLVRLQSSKTGPTELIGFDYTVFVTDRQTDEKLQRGTELIDQLPDIQLTFYNLMMILL